MTLPAEDRTRFEQAHPPIALADGAEARELPSHRLPRLMGWQVLLQPRQLPEQTKGGLFLPDQVKDINEHHNCIYKVLKLGPLAFTAERLRGGRRRSFRQETVKDDVTVVEEWEEVEFAEGQQPPEVGDWVFVRKYSGTIFEVDDVSLRMCSDDDIVAVVRDPTGYKAYVG